MKKALGTRRLATVITVACLIGGCSAAPPATDSSKSGYYVVNPDGQVYKDGHGHCWHVTNRQKTQSDLRKECGDTVASTPPQDSDGDGVPDSRDHCPNTPAGTAVDANGCPVEKTAPIVLKGVTFAFDSAKLTSQAQDRLDNVIDALQASPEVDFRIDGYTDSTGSHAYNLALSQRRVDAVQQYLISHGIAASRITATQGHGASDPVATNKTAGGRAQNRRVALNVAGE